MRRRAEAGGVSPAGRGGRRRTLGAGIALIGMLVGCAPVADLAWAPATWAPAAVHVVDAPQALDAAADPALAETLTALRIRNDTVALAARAVFLPGRGEDVAAFNRATQRTLDRAIADQEDAAGGAYAPEVFAPGAGLGDRGCLAGSTAWAAVDILATPETGPPGGVGTAVVCDIAVAAGTVLAQRMRVVTGNPEAVTGDVTVLRYTDTSTGEITTAQELWVEGAAARLSADVIDALRRDAGALSLRDASAGDDAQIAAIRAGLETTVARGGEMVFTIAPGFTAPELAELGVATTTEPLPVAVPAAVAEPLLTDMGRRVLAASAQPYAGPPAVPASREWVDCDLAPCVALTYDDGPSGFTGPLLDTLRDERATAAFYVLGQYAAGNPDMVRRIAAEAHLVGNHTWDHPSLPSLEPEQIERQLSRTRALLRDLSGQSVSTFRPPYGEFDAEVLAVAGQPAILWNVDTRDWAGGPATEIQRVAVEDARPGGIILFHDTHEQSVRMTPDVITGLRDRGFTLASLSQLFDGDIPSAGAWRGAP